jgi:hypothetical protein
MDTTRPQLTFVVVLGEQSLLCIIPFDFTATYAKGIDNSVAIKLWIWLVSKQFTSSNNQPGSRMAAIQSKNII